jgi:hypothetical protein
VEAPFFSVTQENSCLIMSSKFISGNGFVAAVVAVAGDVVVLCLALLFPVSDSLCRSHCRLFIVTTDNVFLCC